MENTRNKNETYVQEIINKSEEYDDGNNISRSYMRNKKCRNLVQNTEEINNGNGKVQEVIIRLKIGKSVSII